MASITELLKRLVRHEDTTGSILSGFEQDIKNREDFFRSQARNKSLRPIDQSALFSAGLFFKNIVERVNNWNRDKDDPIPLYRHQNTKVTLDILDKNIKGFNLSTQDYGMKLAHDEFLKMLGITPDLIKGGFSKEKVTEQEVMRGIEGFPFNIDTASLTTSIPGVIVLMLFRQHENLPYRISLAKENFAVQRLA